LKILQNAVRIQPCVRGNYTNIIFCIGNLRVSSCNDLIINVGGRSVVQEAVLVSDEMSYSPVFLNRRAAARYRALA